MKPLFAAILITLLATSVQAAGPDFGEAPKVKPAPKTPSAWQTLQNKRCAFSIRLPRGYQLEKISDCAMRIVLPRDPKQAWIQEASLILEVTAAKDGVATERPLDGGTPTGSLTAGGLKFSKSAEEEGVAGKRYVTVSYTAIGKDHQYHFVGELRATNPEMLGTPVRDWNAARSAEKIFDKLLRGFRALE